MYLTIEQAEELRRKYNSWIGKNAHIGKGVTDTLLGIHLVPKIHYKETEAERLYRIEFEFRNQKRYSAAEFLFYNGLDPAAFHPFIPPSTSSST
jgi:hypothetical protein